jgi:AhpD family alkylhydroperoxidase
MEMDNKIKALVAVGASITANCQPCLQSAVQMALETGAKTQEIAAAIEVGKKVLAGAASWMDHSIPDLNDSIRTFGTVSNEGCGCNTLEETKEAG